MQLLTCLLTDTTDQCRAYRSQTDLTYALSRERGQYSAVESDAIVPGPHPRRFFEPHSRLNRSTPLQGFGAHVPSKKRRRRDAALARTIGPGETARIIGPGDGPHHFMKSAPNGGYIQLAGVQRKNNSRVAAYPQGRGLPRPMPAPTRIGRPAFSGAYVTHRKPSPHIGRARRLRGRRMRWSGLRQLRTSGAQRGRCCISSPAAC